MTADEIKAGLIRLGQLAQANEKIVELAIYGGSAIALAWQFRVATKDVDAVIRGDAAFVRTIVKQVAEERDWPEDWLNDSVKGFISGNETMLPLGNFPSPEHPYLRVYVPTPEYMLAMKCMAMRVGPEESDINDINHLIDIIGAKSAKDVMALVERFYPKHRIPPKVAFGIEEIFENRSN